MIVRRHMCGGIKVSEIRVTPKTTSINKGTTVQLSATVLPPDATDPTVLWSSAQTNIATVNNAGLVTGVGKGTATITASAVNGDVRDTSVISVIVPVSRVTLNTTQRTQNKGTTYQLTATVEPADASDTRISWSSANTNIATVDQSGLVTFRANGSTVITVQSVADSSKKATCSVTTNVPVSGISLNQTYAEKTVGDTFQLYATITPSDASNKGITWTSNNTGAATVDQSGYVRCIGQATGGLTITARTHDGGYVATCTLIVKPQYVPATSIKITPSYIGDGSQYANYTFTATVTPSNATDPVTWRLLHNASNATLTPNGMTCNVYVKRLPTNDSTVVVEATCGGKTAVATINAIYT